MSRVDAAAATLPLRARLADLAQAVLAARSLPWLVVALGGALRLLQYGRERSLFKDESFVALNILDRSYGELLDRLDYGQGAPPLFLISVKAVTDLFGSSEFALRFVPLLGALVSLVAFYKVAERCAGRAAAVLGLIVLSVSPPFLYFSSDVKQYSTDAAVALLLLWGALALAERRALGWREVAAAAAGAAGALWLSHSAVFVVASSGAVLLALALARRDWSSFRRLAAASAAALGSFVVFAIVALPDVEGNRRTFVGSLRYPSLAEGAPGLARFVKRSTWTLVRYLVGPPFGLPARLMTALAGVFILAGLVWLARRHRDVLALLVGPIVLAFVAAGLHRYPIIGRTTLFFLPVLALLIGVGLWRAFLGLRAYSTRLGAAAAVLGAGVAAAFVAGVAVTGAKVVHRPLSRQEVRPVLQYIRNHWRAQDSLYLDWQVQYAARYYAQQEDLNRDRSGTELWPAVSAYGLAQYSPALESEPPRLIVGTIDRRDRTPFEHRLASLRGRRAWFVLSRLPGRRRDFAFYVSRLDASGTRLRVVHARAVSAYLYDVRAG